MEKVVPIWTLEKWLPIFWIIGLAVAILGVFMAIEYLKSRKRSDKKD